MKTYGNKWLRQYAESIRARWWDHQISAIDAQAALVQMGWTFADSRRFLQG